MTTTQLIYRSSAINEAEEKVEDKAMSFSRRLAEPRAISSVASIRSQSWLSLKALRSTPRS
jgi:hypothetical protein